MTILSGCVTGAIGLLLLFVDYKRRTWLPALWRAYIAGPWLVLSGVLQAFDVPSGWQGSTLRLALSLVGIVLSHWNLRTTHAAILADMGRVFSAAVVDPAEVERHLRRLRGEEP